MLEEQYLIHESVESMFWKLQSTSKHNIKTCGYWKSPNDDGHQTRWWPQPQDPFIQLFKIVISNHWLEMKRIATTRKNEKYSFQTGTSLLWSEHYFAVYAHLILIVKLFLGPEQNAGSLKPMIIVWSACFLVQKFQLPSIQYRLISN